MHWALLLGIAITSDVLDYFGGAIPGIGDLLDLVTTTILLPYIGIESGLGLIELVPGADILPTFTVLALATVVREYRKQGELQGLDIPRKSPVPGRQQL